MSKELDREIVAAKAALALGEKHTAKATDYRVQAGEHIRNAYKIGAAEGVGKAKVAERIGISVSWARELAGIRDEGGAEAERGKQRTRRKRYDKKNKRARARATAVPNGGADDAEDQEELDAAIKNNKANEHPEHFTSAYLARVEQAIQFSRESVFLSTGMLKHAKKPDEVRQDIVAGAQAVIEAWTGFLKQVNKGVPNDREEMESQRA